MPSNLDYEMETLMGVLDQIQVGMYVCVCKHACGVPPSPCKTQLRPALPIL